MGSTDAAFSVVIVTETTSAVFQMRTPQRVLSMDLRKAHIEAWRELAARYGFGLASLEGLQLPETLYNMLCAYRSAMVNVRDMWYPMPAVMAETLRTLPPCTVARSIAISMLMYGYGEVAIAKDNNAEFWNSVIEALASFCVSAIDAMRMRELLEHATVCFFQVASAARESAIAECKFLDIWLRFGYMNVIRVYKSALPESSFRDELFHGVISQDEFDKMPRELRFAYHVAICRALGGATYITPQCVNEAPHLTFADLGVTDEVAARSPQLIEIVATPPVAVSLPSDDVEVADAEELTSDSDSDNGNAAPMEID